MPIDAAEFDANKDLSTIITQFLCRNRDKGFSAREIAQATGISEADVNNSMMKLSFSDIASSISGRKKNFKIDDVTISGVIYYRCVSE
jgi:DNA-binding IscR family transcriptional regulator